MLKNNMEVFFMQVKMNLMRAGRFVPIERILTSTCYSLNGFYGPEHCAKCITWVTSYNRFFKIGNDISDYIYTLDSW